VVKRLHGEKGLQAKAFGFHVRMPAEIGLASYKGKQFFQKTAEEP
jgi:hypothetical protein